MMNRNMITSVLLMLLPFNAITSVIAQCEDRDTGWDTAEKIVINGRKGKPCRKLWKFCSRNQQVSTKCPVTCGRCPCSDFNGNFSLSSTSEKEINCLKVMEKPKKWCKGTYDSNVHCPATCGTCCASGYPKLKAPVTLRLSENTVTAPSDYNDIMRMYMSGGNSPFSYEPSCPGPDVVWKNQSDFWYLEVSPTLATGKTCPIQGGGNTIGTIYTQSNIEVSDSQMSTCNVYDFRVFISNNLTEDATIHYHGLTPPTPFDGVPFVTTPNIKRNSVQYYRFQQLTYSGMYWMHSHWGFHEALGIAAPIIMQHDKQFLLANSISEDLIVQLEDDRLYPKCAFSGNDVYQSECAHISNKIWNAKVFFINREEKPLIMRAKGETTTVRVRFLNSGTQWPWRISSNSTVNTEDSMEIIATDGNDVIRNNTNVASFFLGIANRIDVLVNITGNTITVITAQAAKNMGGPVKRSIRICGSEVSEVECGLFQPKVPSYSTLAAFSTYENLKAQHPLGHKPNKQQLRTYTIVNRGGDMWGGFPLSVSKMRISEGMSLEEFVNTESNFLTQAHTYTELNNLKYHLHPFKTWKHNVTGEQISSRRGCHGCTTDSYDPKNTNYMLKYSAGIVNKTSPIQYPNKYTQCQPNLSNRCCCWEWCDVPVKECNNWKLHQVEIYDLNKNFIPVCYGDRVEISFVNYGYNDMKSSHPIHLHGHDFSIKAFYSITGTGSLTQTHYYPQLDGPLLDTIWVKAGQAVTFQFDAFNPGEHLIHCHKDLHLLGGMLTTVRYQNDTECENEFLATDFYGGEGNDFPTHVLP